MKSEQAAFGARLSAALAAADVEESPSELVKLLARYNGTPVTPQAVSGWLGGKHMPRQANMRALAAMLGVDPFVLQYGSTSGRAVREPRTAWPENLSSRNRLAFEEFLALPAAQQKLVRDLIAAFADAPARRKHSR
jgi:sugar phosphate isomerase/epimerase